MSEFDSSKNRKEFGSACAGELRRCLKALNIKKLKNSNLPFKKSYSQKHFFLMLRQQHLWPLSEEAEKPYRIELLYALNP